MRSADFPIGCLVLVGGPYIAADNLAPGAGHIGVDAWTGLILKVFGVSGDDLLLGRAKHGEYEVAIHHGRCKPVTGTLTFMGYVWRKVGTRQLPVWRCPRGAWLRAVSGDVRNRHG